MFTNPSYQLKLVLAYYSALGTAPIEIPKHCHGVADCYSLYKTLPSIEPNTLVLPFHPFC